MIGPSGVSTAAPVGLPRYRLCGTTVCYPTHSPSDQFSLRRALQGIAAAGLRCVELAAIPGYCEHLAPARMDAAAVPALQSLLADYDLSPIALNATANLTTDAGVADFEHALQLAQRLGIGLVVTSIQQTETESGLRQFMDRAPRLQLLAEQMGLIIALETHRGHLNTGARGVELLRRLGTDRIRIAYDTANVLNRGGVLPEADLASIGPDIGRYIAHVHLKDKASLTIGERVFPVLGTGVLDLPASLALLRQGGYWGALSLEVELDGAPETPEQVDEALTASMRYLDQLGRDWPAA